MAEYTDNPKDISIKVDSYIDCHPDIKKSFHELQEPEKRSFKDGLALLFKIRGQAVDLVDLDSKVLLGSFSDEKDEFRSQVQEEVGSSSKYFLNQNSDQNWIEETSKSLFRLVKGENTHDFSGQRNRVFEEAFEIRTNLQRSGEYYLGLVQHAHLVEQTNQYLNYERPNKLHDEIDPLFNELDIVLSSVRHPDSRDREND